MEDSSHRPKHDDGATPTAQPPHDPLRTNSLIESYYYIRKQITISEETKDVRTEQESTIEPDALAAPEVERVPELDASPESLSGEDAAGQVEPDRGMPDTPSTMAKGGSIPSSLPSPPHGPTATMLDAEKQAVAATGRGAQPAAPHLPKPTQYSPETMSRPRPSPPQRNTPRRPGGSPALNRRAPAVRMPATEDLKDRRPFRTETGQEAAGRSHSGGSAFLGLASGRADGGAPEILAWLAERPGLSEVPPPRAAEPTPARPRRLTIGALRTCPPATPQPSPTRDRVRAPTNHPRLADP
ncbi:translation initiation factor IF-2-like [Scyliorhinus canicula]|uniref:translation initiation factor IF-2-like n=1 Tax=Scyliorhinus canicula TaxID=7830 RepID=UPI0018F408C6|nr:translation initiation factor IF-2-like [Scyliorhinus canicula]